MNKYPKAREELKDALNILLVNTHANTYQEEEQRHVKLAIRKRINQAIINLDDKSAHHLSPRIQEAQKPANFMEKIKKSLNPSNTSLPEQTSYEQSSEENLEDINPISVPSAKPHTIHVTIPIDVNALEHLPVASACLTPDLAKKLRDFTESIK